MIGPPPVEHLPLDLDRARCCGVDGGPQRRQIGAGAFSLVELEHPDEVGRHELRLGDAVGLDDGEGAGGIEGLHDDDGAAQALHRRGPAQRGGVVQRRRAQVDAVGREPEQALDQQDERRHRLAVRAVVERRLDALRPAGRARRVEHERALALVVEWARRVLGDGRLVGRPARQVAIDHEPGRDLAEVRVEAGGDGAQRRRGDDRLGVAVGEDVAGFSGLQVPVDRGAVQACSRGRPEDLEVPGVVLEQDGEVVAGLEAGGPQELREPA